MASTPHVVIKTSKSDFDENAEFGFLTNRLNGTGETALSGFRQQALERYYRIPNPTGQDEAWRRTSLKSMPKADFHLSADNAFQNMTEVPANLREPVADLAHGGELILLPGGVEAHLSEDLQNSGVIFTDLRSAEKNHPELLQKVLGKVISPDSGKFAALSFGAANSGIFLYIPKGVKVEQPLHSLLWAPGELMAYITNLVVFVDDGATVTYVHEYASPTEEKPAFHAGTIELFVGDNANLQFVELQSFGEHFWNLTHERARIKSHGELHWTFGAMGGRTTKTFADIDMDGEGSVGKMSGFYFTDKKQHLDYDSQQNHFKPNTTSDLLFKGALIDESRAVWQGMVYVAPGAFKTDGYQTNRNLILSKKARADSIPGLEILADDVRCSHGATIGKIDEDQIFYLQARGISRLDAEKLIVKGFFEEIMDRIPFEGVKARFASAIDEKMARFVSENS